MDNLARRVERDEAFLECGTVTGVEGGRITVETGVVVAEATRAVSCLIEPLPGDTVVVSRTESGRCHVLGILEREADGATSLAFEGDVELKTDDGHVRVAAREGIGLFSPGETTLVSRRLAVHSGEAEVLVPRLSFFGTFLQAQVDTIKLFGRACDSVFERVSQRVRRCFRRVEELDQVTAGQLDCRVKKLLSLRGKYSVITAEEDVRINGDKILMG
jgi:hypothetical protein